MIYDSRIAFQPRRSSALRAMIALTTSIQLRDKARELLELLIEGPVIHARETPQDRPACPCARSRSSAMRFKAQTRQIRRNSSRTSGDVSIVFRSASRPISIAVILYAIYKIRVRDPAVACRTRLFARFRIADCIFGEDRWFFFSFFFSQYYYFRPPSR